MPAMRFLRLLLIVGVALLVPLQGLAAVAAGQCMALGHHQGGDGHAHQDTQDGAGHDHDAHVPADDGAVTHGDDGKSPHCGPCVACCASASISGTAGIAIDSSPSHARYFFSQAQPLGVQPDGLFRPPLAL